MRSTMWRPEFSDGANGDGWKNNGNSLGEGSREKHLNNIVNALHDSTSNTLVVRGEHGDDRIELITRAHQLTTHPGNIIHVVGTTYARNLRYGALAFLLADLEAADEPGPSDVMKAITRRVSRKDGGRIILVQYPQLIDVHSRTVLAQLAFHHNIVLVVLAERAESLPAEFAQICRGGEHHEVQVGPLRPDEAHALLARNFAAAATPMALAALWHRSQGIPEWLTALAHDSLASGKLLVRDGHLVLTAGPWPRGGRLEAMVLSQTAVLQQPERDLLCAIARAGSAMVRELDAEALESLDRLIGWGFIQRRVEDRDVVKVRSPLLADELRAGSGIHDDAPVNRTSIHGSFHDFLACTLYSAQGIMVDDEDARTTRDLLEGLRRSLLSGALGSARKYVRDLQPCDRLTLSGELFEVVVLAQAILDLIAVSPAAAQPALDAIGTQLEGSGLAYDQWLVQSMGNFLRDEDDPAKHAPLAFDRSWDSARWWLSELLASTDSTKLREPRDAARPGPGGSWILETLVAIRHGYPPPPGLPGTAQEPAGPGIKAAFDLMTCNDAANREGRLAAGLVVLLEAGFAVFAHPCSNRALDGLTPVERAGLANKRKRGHSVAASNGGWFRARELQERDYPVLEVLTKREKFVASAVARGLNNQQIAKDAGVSIRTVEGHLYQIYSKLSLAGRRDLCSLVASDRKGGDSVL